MSDSSIIPWLFGFTLIVALLLGIWQWFRVRQAQKLGTPAVPGQAPGEMSETLRGTADKTAPLVSNEEPGRKR